MLITCPECQKEISDKAKTCPGCGYPLNESTPTTTTAKKQAKKIYGRKRMRLPNGFGRITEIKNKNLRNPFRVMVTTGVDKNGRPIGKLLKPKAYFKTYNEAYQALMEFNKSPYDIANDITIEELFNLWYPEYIKTVSVDRKRSVKSAWNYCDPIKNIRIHELKPAQIKEILDNGFRIDSDGNKVDIPDTFSKGVKTILSLMFDLAIERELIDKNPARGVKLKKEKHEKKKEMHTNYTLEEIEHLKNHLDNFVAQFLYIQCYSGWRPSELLNISIENIDIENWTFTGGMKTNAGYDRTVPIHSKIQQIVKARYDEAVRTNKKYLFAKKDGEAYPYRTFERHYTIELPELQIDLSHKLHDGRVTFITLAKNADVDEYAIKRIVGHSINDLTERVYTRRSIEWLKEQIEKIK